MVIYTGRSRTREKRREYGLLFGGHSFLSSQISFKIQLLLNYIRKENIHLYYYNSSAAILYKAGFIIY